MLTSRVAELEKRDRLNAKGKDGGSFIPSAVLITGTTKAGAGNDTIITLPRYVAIDNFLGAIITFRVNTAGAGDEWVVLGNDKASTKDFNFRYNQEDNTIILDDMDANVTEREFRLTVFYKG